MLLAKAKCAGYAENTAAISNAFFNPIYKRKTPRIKIYSHKTPKPHQRNQKSNRVIKFHFKTTTEQMILESEVTVLSTGKFQTYCHSQDNARNTKGFSLPVCCFIHHTSA